MTENATDASDRDTGEGTVVTVPLMSVSLEGSAVLDAWARLHREIYHVLQCII